MVGVQKRKIQWVISLFLVMLYFYGLPAQAQYGGGSGEPNDPYLIYTAEQMNAIGADPNDWGKHFKLMVDIDLSGFDGEHGRPAFKIIGTSYDNAFTGVFDGKGHTISNLTITGGDHLGLFSCSASGAEIKGLGLLYVNIASSGEYGDYVGSLVGWNYGVVSGCYSTGSVRGDDYVGGLLGGNSGHVVRCYSTVTVNGDRYLGGLVGWNSGPITNCYATGRVMGSGYDIGGLVGTNYGALTACYSIGAVSGGSWVGGLVGDNEAYKTNGYATGCFWDINTSGQATSAGGKGLTTTQMQEIRTYLDAGWDWVGENENGTSEVWLMPEGVNYPALAIFSGYTPLQLQGLGTPEDPYIISDPLELGAMVYYSPHAHYRLGASIDLADIHWAAAVIPWFGGTFDGNGMTISHMTVTDGSYLGLFGRLGSEGKIIKLSLMDVSITGSGNYVGGLVGTNGGNITNCYAEAVTVFATSSGWAASAGGLVGSNGGNITSCYIEDGSVSGIANVGGLVGRNYDTGSVTKCYSGGALSGDENVGGLMGNNEGYVSYCYSTGVVSGDDCVGGLVGGNSGDVIRCYSTGAVRGDGSVGGLVGSGDPVRVKDSVWDVETSGLTFSAAGVGLTTAEMMDPEMLGLNGLGGDPNWILDSGQDYPRLLWEGTTGQIIPEPVIDWLDGTGIPEDPFWIESADQLLLLHKSSLLWDKHFILNADINLDPNLPGRDIFGQAVIHTFEGSFIGSGHVILNLQIEGGDSLGLFGKLIKGSVVRDLGLENVSVHGTGSNVGGLVGYNVDGHVFNCYSTGTVNGSYDVGGLVGYNQSFVTECYSTAVVSGDWSAGGLVGSGNLDRVTYCFWDTKTSGQDTSAGGTGLTTVEMQTASTFLNAGWDFVGETENGTQDIWWILEGQDYPKLRELPEGILLRPLPAFCLDPKDGATDVTPLPILCWAPADPNVRHDIYLGESKQAVVNATTLTSGIYRGRLPGEVTTYDAGILEWDKTYYWRIDEVNQDDPNSPQKGNVWSFTTADFIVVDDFESYNDLDPPGGNRIWNTWLDGYDIPTNGSLVGYIELPFVGRTIAHTGTQSMSFYYDNSVGYSEATANVDNLVIGQDWTIEGVRVLSLWFGDVWGSPSNAPEPMYVALANANGSTAVIYHDSPNAAQIDTWTEWRIDLQEFANKGVDLTKINTISIGFGNKNNPLAGGSGTMYFDDIRLYRPAEPKPETEP